MLPEEWKAWQDTEREKNPSPQLDSEGFFTRVFFAILILFIVWGLLRG